MQGIAVGGYNGSRAGGYRGPGWDQTGLKGHCPGKRRGMVVGSLRRLEGRCFRVELSRVLGPGDGGDSGVVRDVHHPGGCAARLREVGIWILG